VADHDNRGAGGDGGPERDQVTGIELRLSLDPPVGFR